MSVTSRDFLASAESAFTTKNEIGWRNAASRAYYAGYHYCHEFHAGLPTPGLQPPEKERAGEHAILIHQLCNPTIPDADPRKGSSRKLGYMLREHLKVRVKADYRLGANFLESEAEDTIKGVHKILRVR